LSPWSADEPLLSRNRLGQCGIALKSEKNFHPTYTDIIVFESAAHTLKNYPMINAVFEDGELRSYASVNVAVGIALDGGLINRVVSEADKKSLVGVSSAIADLSEKAKTGTLDSPRLWAELIQYRILECTESRTSRQS
jgi:pyruvate/2-oxoglutarate dehydrogenase complex dihydrolipoamide acyltransferase (E2) component